jgi:hypothetical protein
MKPYAIGRKTGFLAAARYHLSVFGERQFSAQHGGRKFREPAR